MNDSNELAGGIEVSIMIVPHHDWLLATTAVIETLNPCDRSFDNANKILFRYVVYYQ